MSPMPFFNKAPQTMEEYFVIPKNRIDPSWNPPDPTMELFLLEYCQEYIEVPIFLIHFIYMSEEGIEIILRNIQDWMIGEPWYLRLFDLSTYNRVA